VPYRRPGDGNAQEVRLSTRLVPSSAAGLVRPSARVPLPDLPAGSPKRPVAPNETGVAAASGPQSTGESTTRRAEIALELAGPAAAVSDPAAASERDIGVRFLFRQVGSLSGGSTEMARNIISERMLGMPREYAADRDLPFSQVKRGRSAYDR
jgi:hypothetical protein